MITKIIDWEVRKELSKDDFLRIGVTWDCLKNLGHLLCSSEALIKRPARDACLCMGELQAPPAPPAPAAPPAPPAPPAPHFVFLITL